jgi:hypothetical protein
MGFAFVALYSRSPESIHTGRLTTGSNFVYSAVSKVLLPIVDSTRHAESILRIFAKLQTFLFSDGHLSFGIQIALSVV